MDPLRSVAVEFKLALRRVNLQFWGPGTGAEASDMQLPSKNGDALIKVT